ncbi:MAG TPA: hypothetical protein VNL16_00075 [Chloroflexota bacterium]|nr:hypothetical protein [Chloroflexota bacterium]
MSLKTWREEFYPTAAAAQTTNTAVAHSLLKWIGLRPENLAKHGLTATRSRLDGATGELSFFVTSNTCALCVLYFDADSDDPCVTCPLSVSRGNVACDEGDSPYEKFVEGNNPEPMIAALKKLRAEEGSRR